MLVKKLWNTGWRVAVGTAFACLGAELACRNVSYQPMVFHEVFGLVPKPGAEGRRGIGREGYGRSHFTIHGIRRSTLPGEHDLAPILVLGDSYTDAPHVNDAEVYTSVLEREFKTMERPRPVLNAGAGGRSIADYVAYAGFYSKTFKPVWVVIQAGESDFTMEAWDRNGPRFEYQGGQKLITSVPPAIFFTKRSSFSRGLLAAQNYSGLVLNMKYRYIEFRQWWSEEPPIFNASRGKSSGLGPVARDYPIEAELDLLMKTYEGRVTLLYTTPFYDPARLSNPSEVDERVERFARSRGISFVKLNPVFRELAARGVAANGFANTRPFQGHWNAAGHAAVAEALAAELKRIASTNGFF